VDPILEVRSLRKRYGRVVAVDGVSIAVDEGEAFGYLGPNGAGKTTTIRCLLGLVTPTEGDLRLFGKPVGHDLQDILPEVGYLPGEFGLWPAMTGREVLDYLGDLHSRPPGRREELTERFDLSPSDLRRQVRFYSRGMKQKVGIIQAFQHGPRLVILDEPTEGLDPVMKDRFITLLKEHTAAGGTLFLSSHILSEVELATDRVSILRKGRLVRVGPTRDLTGERVRHCTLALRSPAPEGALDLPGVTDLHAEDTRYRFDFRGEMAELIRRLATLEVQEFLAEPESLTEAFFDVYGDEP
jgi:ABC-2 type transport system ATP-binding protein